MTTITALSHSGFLPVTSFDLTRLVWRITG